MAWTPVHGRHPVPAGSTAPRHAYCTALPECALARSVGGVHQKLGAARRARAWVRALVPNAIPAAHGRAEPQTRVYLTLFG